MRTILFVIVGLAGCSGNQSSPPSEGSADKVAPSAAAGKELNLQPVNSKVAMQEKKLLDGRVTMLIPKEFQVMSEEMLRIKYPNERRPTLVYTNESGSVNIALNHTQNKMPAAHIPQFHKNMESTFKKVYPSATWFRSDLVAINGREFFVLDLRTPAADTPVRNIMVATSCQGRMLLVSYNVVEKLEPEWLSAGNKAIMSIRVSD